MTQNLERKLEVLREKPVVIGGTFFEVVYVEDRLDDYKRWLGELGLTHVEISDGTVDIPRERKLELIADFARDFTVLSEVGSKDSSVEYEADEWKRWLQEELDAGAWKVITEAREGGTAGIFDSGGGMRTELIGEIAAAVGTENVVFEAPSKAAQAWFVKEFGPSVNLGNIPPDEVIPLETLRRGLRGDTLKQILLAMSWAEVRASRLARSHLADRAPADRLVEVVRDVCGIHAQVMGSAELQLAARVEGITQADVRKALWERRALAKTWTTRGTLHIHPADELSLWTAARRAVEEPGRVDLVPAIGDALRGGPWTREQLADAVLERAPQAPRDELASGWGFHLSDAATAGLLCFGPPEGAKVTFVHVEEWLGPQRPWGPVEALQEVTRRYATTFAPVGLRQLRQWLAAKVYVDVPEVAPTSASGGSVRLLPEYDPYVMGFRERDELVPPAVRAQIKAHGKGRYEGPAGTPFLLVDGVCAGIWRRRKTAKRIELTVEPARKLTRAERAGVDAEAERIGAFLGLEPRLSVDR